MRDELGLGGNAERGPVEPENAAVLVGRGVPGHGAIAEIGERMTERRQLPVEDADHLGLLGVKEQVAKPEIAMGDRDMTVIVRQVRRQPVGDHFQFGDGFARRSRSCFVQRAIWRSK